MWYYDLKWHGEHDEQKHYTREQHDDREYPPQITCESYVPKTERWHDGQGPVKTGDPGVVFALILHDEVENRAVDNDRNAHESQELSKWTQVSLNLLVLKEVSQLRRHEFHKLSLI